MTMRSMFRNEVITLVRVAYQDGSLAVRAISPEGEPLATISVRLADAPVLPKDTFWLKDWSENAALVGCLLRDGVIELDTDIPEQRSGFVHISAARLVEHA